MKSAAWADRRLTTTHDGMTSWGADYSSKRLRSDRSRKSRGSKTRSQGGEVLDEDEGNAAPF